MLRIVGATRLAGAPGEEAAPAVLVAMRWQALGTLLMCARIDARVDALDVVSRVSAHSLSHLASAVVPGQVCRGSRRVAHGRDYLERGSLVSGGGGERSAATNANCGHCRPDTTLDFYVGILHSR